MEMEPKSRKVPVIYYLCRNRLLEHPHFTQVPLVSPDGLYLRDVIQKFDALRGRGMASMYSWSCKRSYKNAFVWNDLCEDDLILPAHGNEYVLKGSELVEQKSSGRFAPAPDIKLQLPEPPSSITQDDSSSSITMSARETKNSHDDDLSGLSNAFTKYRIYKSHGLADASTQTEKYHVKLKETCTRSLSIHSSPFSKTNSSSSGACSLESLMKADVYKLNSSKRLEAEEKVPSNTKLKASNMLLQLISCGSISAEDHKFCQILSNRQPSLGKRFSSRLVSSSIMLGELDCLSENPKFILEDKEHLSGSGAKKEGFRRLKLSSSCSANWMNTRTKCMPISMLSKQPRSTSMRSVGTNGGTKRMAVTKRMESLRNNNKENMVKYKL